MTLNIFKILTTKKTTKRKSKSTVDPIEKFVSMSTRDKKKFVKKAVYKAQHPRHRSKIEKKRKAIKSKTKARKTAKR